MALLRRRVPGAAGTSAPAPEAPVLILSDVHTRRQKLWLCPQCAWQIELDIRDIKQTLGLDHVRCKTPEMVERQLWTTLLAYNLIRKVMATAAALHGKQPRQLGFTLACQTILSSWMLLATGSCRNAQELRRSALGRIAANEVANRPGRIEPRVLKRRRHRYPLMTRPRPELRQDLCAT